MFAKFLDVPTLVGTIFDWPVMRHASWVQSFFRWLQVNATQAPTAEPKALGQWMQEKIWQEMAAKDNSASYRWYSGSMFQVSPKFLARPVWNKSLLCGVVALVQMRCNTFMTASRLGHFVPQLSAQVCPCCHSPSSRETVEHVLLHCSKWIHDRDMYIVPVLRAFQRFGVQLTSDKERCRALLGGGQGHKFWLRRVRGSSLFTCVVGFLAAVIPVRARILFPSGSA